MFKRPKVVIVGPGGIKGIDVLGFLSTLIEYDLLDQVHTYCGVSVGSLVSLLMVCGFDIEYIIDEALNFEMGDLASSLSFESTLENQGLFSMSIIRNKLVQMLTAKFGSVPTLLELYQLTNKTYAAVTFNVTKNCREIMDHTTHPTLSCIDATIASMSIPLVFHKCVIDSCQYVDGALIDPYPVECYDDGKTVVMGIFVIEPEGTDQTKVKGPFQVLTSGLIEQVYRLKVAAASSYCFHIKIKDSIDETLGLHLTKESKSKMVENGRKIARNILKSLIVKES